MAETPPPRKRLKLLAGKPVVLNVGEGIPQRHGIPVHRIGEFLRPCHGPKCSPAVLAPTSIFHFLHERIGYIVLVDPFWERRGLGGRLGISLPRNERLENKASIKALIHPIFVLALLCCIIVLVLNCCSSAKLLGGGEAFYLYFLGRYKKGVLPHLK